MRLPSRPILAAVVLMVLCSACTQSAPLPHPRAPTPVTDVETGETTFDQGDRPPQRVFYAVAGNPAQATVLVVLHGVNRNAEDYRDTWVPLVAGHNAIVVAPEFSEEDFPGVPGYNLGGVVDEKGRAQPQDQWAFARVEPLVDHVVDRLGGPSGAPYSMFGHSAGAQFVHRYLEFMPHARVSRVVVANAGWYTLPETATPFPYGLKNAPPNDLRAFLACDLVVLLGGDDTGDENLRQDEGAKRQGRTRVERGFTFFDSGKAVASQLGVRFGWQVRILPGAVHDNAEMAAGSVPILLS